MNTAASVAQVQDISQTIREIVNIGQTKFGIDYLRSLVRNTGTTLNIKYTFVGHVSESDANTIETDVVWANNAYAANFHYPLHYTPCEIVLSGNRVCLYDRGVATKFPRDKLLSRLGVESYVGSPALTPRGELLGLLVLVDDKPIEDPERLIAIVDFLALRVTAEYERFNIESRLHTLIELRTEELQKHNYSLQKTVEELELVKRKLEMKSRLDPLTGINNREWITALARSQLRIAQRNGLPLALLFIDLDHFKHVNDNYGHGIGDTVLKAAVERLRQCIRETDILGRFGGEEFIILSPHSGVKSAARLAARILASLAGQAIATDAGDIHITTSVGITSTEQGTHTFTDLVEQADIALYEAKERGRNRYCDYADAASSP